MHLLVSSPLVLASSSLADWPLSLGVTRPKRVRLRYGLRLRRIEASLRWIAPPCARLATCVTSNSHGELLSVHEINQAWPGAPKPQSGKGFLGFCSGLLTNPRKTFVILLRDLAPLREILVLSVEPRMIKQTRPAAHDATRGRPTCRPWTGPRVAAIAPAETAGG